ncbi:MAG: hypothetical protein L3K02_02240 [Thermoplasmata archaeon]|nr:hypothetical protein [Thermoplasmata archaeon]
MTENSDGDEFSVLAFVLVLLASLLVLLEGILLLVAGAIVGAISPTVGGAVSGLGFVGVLLALVLGSMAYVLYRFPESSRVAGVVVLLVSFLSFFTGGGFFLGLVLGIVGGIVAILFDPGIDLEFDTGEL